MALGPSPPRQGLMRGMVVYRGSSFLLFLRRERFEFPVSLGFAVFGNYQVSLHLYGKWHQGR